MLLHIKSFFSFAGIEVKMWKNSENLCHISLKEKKISALISGNITD